MSERSSSPAIQLASGKQINGGSFTYNIIKYIGHGGSGVVYRAHCEVRQEDVAVKFFIPIYAHKFLSSASDTVQQQAIKDLQEHHRKELSCLHQISHPTIVRILDSGTYQPSTGELSDQFTFVQAVSFFVMEFIPGSDIRSYLQRNDQPKAQVASLLRTLAEGLIYLHEEKKYLHQDIKAENIMVRAGTSEPVIIDFALYKNLNFEETDPKGMTRLDGDWDLFPKFDGNHPLKKFKETPGSREELMELGFPGLDLYQFGLLLQSLKPQFRNIFASDEIRYIELIEQELLDWEKVQSLKTVDARWLRDQFSKLNPAYSQFMGVEELTPPSSAKQTVQLPGKVVTISPFIDQLSNTRSFRRLRSINQLALVDVIYPGAGYRRNLHCFRAYSYCAELIESLTQSPRFRLLFSPLLARQALAMSLLHDINHFPFLHTIQEAIGKPMKNVDLLDLFCNGCLTKDKPSIYELLEDEVKLPREQFKDLLLLEHHELVEKGYKPGLQIVKSMIDSGADVDKLAYLEDDSFFTGVAYGHGVDSRQLIASATIVKIPLNGTFTNQGWHLGFHDEGLSAVESLVMARYWMFRAVYWHRINRAIMAMLLHVIRELYVEPHGNAQRFVEETMWLSEEQALDYLNKLYRKKKNGRDSITNDILKDHRTVYRRLLSIQGVPEEEGGVEANLYRRLAKLSEPHHGQQLEEYRKIITKSVEDFIYTSLGIDVSIGDDDLLLDIPTRRLGNLGEIYIEFDTGSVKKFRDLPGVVGRASLDFERLVNRIRIFVRPEVANKIGEDILIDRRNELLKVVYESLPRNAIDQVR